MSILIVDDDEDAVALLSLLMERQGWKVDAASSVAEAQRALKETGYRVLVADLHLSDGSGTSLLAGPMKAPLRGAILVTGAGDDKQNLEGAEGFGWCLKKPVNGAEIVKIVRSLLEPGAGGT